jgi:integrase
VIEAKNTIAGSLGEAIIAYVKHPAFTEGKGESSQYGDKLRLEWLRERYSHGRAAKLRAQDIEAILAEKAEAPHERRSLHRVLRALLDFCLAQGMIKNNPARAIKLKAPTTKGFHPITDEEVAQFEAKFPIGTKARLAFALCFYTGSRRSDAYRTGPANCRNGRIQLKQRKTGAEIDIPMVKPLADIIAVTNKMAGNRCSRRTPSEG